MFSNAPWIRWKKCWNSWKWPSAKSSLTNARSKTSAAHCASLVIAHPTVLVINNAINANSGVVANSEINAPPAHHARPNPASNANAVNPRTRPIRAAPKISASRIQNRTPPRLLNPPATKMNRSREVEKRNCTSV